MSLTNLTLSGTEHYGGIEMKKSAEKNTYLGFIYSVGLHALLILIYCGWTWITSEDHGKAPTIHHHHVIIGEIGPPPSTSQDISLPLPSAPRMDVAKPAFGIPVPIPDIQAPSQTMPSNDISIPRNDDGTGHQGSDRSQGENNSALPTVQKTEEVEPVLGDFIPDVEEPKPTQDIQHLTEYPQTAIRSNLEGKVTFSALIGKDGRVEKVTIDKADYEVFKQPVIDAVMKVRFTPARQNQTPVRVWYTQTVNFKLH
jgi:TonB family protein